METITISYMIILLTTTFVVAAETIPKITFRVDEEEKSGTFVGNVSNAALNFSDSEKHNLQYIFPFPKGLFSLQMETGNLYTMVKIDRETVCRYKDVCELSLDIAASSPPSIYQEIEVIVIIDDINDNSPLFPVDSQTLSISEDVTSEQNFSIENAVDEDMGTNNGIHSYEIDPPSETFGLREVVNNNAKLQLYVKKSLDRETQSSYQIHVIARDGGKPVNFGTLLVNIEVTDTNDNPPEFSQAVYNVTVEEGTPQDYVILTLSATDKDIQENGNITYRIKQRQANVDKILEDFFINTSTGDIHLKHELVYQANHHYSFIVEAVDNGQQPHVVEAEVLVYVKDAGNNAPIITGSFSIVNVTENSARGELVTVVNVIDTDSGSNGNVSCSVSNMYFDILGSPQSDNYRVVVSNAILDREVIHLHNVTVTCSDHGSPPMSSAKSFLVRVTDVNDNKPIFDVANYMANVFENTMKEQIIIQVSATDKDTGTNKELTYHIPNQDKIVVNNITGVISVKPYFDRETTPVIIFEVIAVDKGIVPLTGTATVTLTIKDRNDNTPQFHRPQYELECAENESSGTSVGQFSAVDYDIGANGQFTFALSTEQVPFTVLANGVLQSNRELDREERSRYDFNVLVIDQGEQIRTGSAQVTIIITDKNDNCPNITFPIKSNKTVYISYPNPETDFVAQVAAYDRDSGENQTLQYSIIQGNEMGIFVIDKTTGRISIQNYEVNINQDMAIPMSIEVKDSGKISLSSTEELIVELTYTNATISTESDDDKKYVVISTVVVIVTVLISAAIIGIIFLLRTLDKKRKLKAENNRSDCDCGFDDKPSLFIVNTSGESSTDPMAAVTTDNGKKKKEVSFSLEDQDSMNSYTQELKVCNVPDPARHPDMTYRSEDRDQSNDLYDKVATRLESLKLQQLLMETRAKQHQQVHIPLPHDDSRSETSGETADSGRGASEEDVPNNSLNTEEAKVFGPFHFQTYAIPNKYSTMKNLQTHPSRSDTYSPTPPPIPCRTYKPYSSFNNHNMNPRPYYSEPAYNHGDSAILNCSVSSWQQQQPQFQSPIAAARLDFSNLASLTPQFRDSIKSRDDDDCSTTTSGSYTIYSEELL